MFLASYRIDVYTNLTNTMITLAVGSKNPVKLNAAINGTKRALENDTITGEGFDVPSGISDQPMTDAETKLGALNRAKAAYKEFELLHGKGPSFSLGLEGGVQLTPENELECFAWIAVFDGAKVGYSRTASFGLPPQIRDLVVNSGMELGHADDQVFGLSNSKQKGGAVGHLSKSVIDRATYYEHAVVLAYIPFHWPEYYPSV